MFEDLDPEQFVAFHLKRLGYQSKEDLFENLYLAAIIAAYTRIDKKWGGENEIRDRFINDMENRNEYTTQLINKGLLRLDFERWINVSEIKKRRLDISFFFTGLDFTIECKRLQSADNQYLIEGINRFIICEYAPNEKYAAMIGFVRGDVSEISGKLKEKIRTYHASSQMSEYLLQNCREHPNSFQSYHKRANDTEIGIYHLFFTFDFE